MKLQFNINSSVLVKLTDAGKNHWNKTYNKNIPKDMLKKYPFEEHYKKCTNNRLYPEYTQFQLHELMEIFGNDIIGCSHFDNNILFDSDDLSRKSKKTGI